MTKTDANIPIQTIARHLGIRTQRVQEKVHRLGLSVHRESLTVNAATGLIETYVHNNKVSVNTREKAESLLERLRNGSVNVSEKAIQAGVRKNRKPSAPITEKEERSTVQKANGFYHAILCTVQSVVQLGVHALESTYFKFVALLVAICVQMQHSANWYERIVPGEQSNMYAAYGYAFMVDLFILVVTMEGKVHIARTFAVLTFLANILYFQFWVDFDGSNQAYTDAISSILISGIIAYIIYAYSELFVKYRKVNLRK